jgi:radical SAM enzyme (TIGR01210 family)
MAGEITHALRNAYYETGTAEERAEIPLEPSALNAKQGLGNFPAFYLQGQHCEKNDCGCCMNCFYSQFHYGNPTAEQIKAQCDYVLDNFERLVLSQQDGTNEFAGERKYPDSKPIFMTLSPTGSFFSDKEFPREVRLDFLKKLYKKSEEYKRDIVLHIEAHALDVVKNQDYIKTSEESELLKKLNAKCILGFESQDEWSRNVLYNKHLPLKSFEDAVKILQDKGIDVGAFTFSGFITYTDTEAKEDMINSVRYLKDKGVFPVLMFSNIQSWTIPDLLRWKGEYHLQEPCTVLDTTYEALKILTDKGKSEPGYYLILEPVEGPPYPEYNIFYDRNDIPGISEEASKDAHEILKNLRATRDIRAFLESWRDFRKNNPEYARYTERIEAQEKSKPEKEERLQNALKTSATHIDEYVKYREEKDIEERDSENLDRYSVLAM